MKEKKHLERNLMENEIFTEAVPTALIMTFLMTVNMFINYEPDDVIVGRGTSRILFFVTFTTSVLSAGLGLAKCLKVFENDAILLIIILIVAVLIVVMMIMTPMMATKVGPCRVLAEGGFLGGLLAPRFQFSY